MRRFGSTTAPGSVPAPLARGVLAGASSPAPTATNDRRDNPGPASDSTPKPGGSSPRAHSLRHVLGGNRQAWTCRRRTSRRARPCGQAMRRSSGKETTAPSAARVQKHTPPQPRKGAAAPSKRKGPQGRGQGRKEGRKEGRGKERRGQGRAKVIV